jgi:hypothetical protein
VAGRTETAVAVVYNASSIVGRFPGRGFVTRQTYHPLIFVAFLLAVFLLVNPVEPDCTISSLRAGHLVEALLLFAATIAVVAIPLLYAQRQTRLRPERFKPRLLSKITWAIIGLNAAFNALMFADYLSHTRVQ